MGGMRRIMASTPLPPGYSWSFGRWERFAQEDAAGASFTWIFALVLVYMIMAALFESFAQPLTIICSVPFALVGVAMVMKLANQPRDSMTDLGAIILVGVVVNNAIVLIDYVNRLRERGLDRTAALIEGGRHRLRPILMTAVTTILGLSPMVAPYFLPEIFGQVEGRAAQWAPVGLVILGGLTTSTFFTLILTPTIYSLVDDLTRIFKRAAGTA
jgi:HAE1 family hydrophobic/amphiphilic exporter-1